MVSGPSQTHEESSRKLNSARCKEHRLPTSSTSVCMPLCRIAYPVNLPQASQKFCAFGFQSLASCLACQPSYTCSEQTKTQVPPKPWTFPKKASQFSMLPHRPVMTASGKRLYRTGSGSVREVILPKPWMRSHASMNSATCDLQKLQHFAKLAAYAWNPAATSGCASCNPFKKLSIN